MIIKNKLDPKTNNGFFRIFTLFFLGLKNDIKEYPENKTNNTMSTNSKIDLLKLK